MAFSSGSSAPPRKYDVFVSFYGDDTRMKFTDHLFGALKRKNLVAFRDNRHLNGGEPIELGLYRAIEGSLIFIVVFSDNYADSSWCLRELEHIFLHRGQPSENRVWPIFYDVAPCIVRKQSGNYENAFARHERDFNDMERVQRWRLVLTEASNISGQDLFDKREYQAIEKFVQKIVDTFGYNFTYRTNDLVGMLSPIEELEKLLLLDSVDNVRTVGIYGMSGVGKTTLASVLYSKMKNSPQFGACCFIDDVSKSFRQHGPFDVQKQILRQVLGEELNQIFNLYDAANLMQSRLCRHRVLIIFDNVDHTEQLEKLALNRKLLAAGSRIIVVCRDLHILKEYRMDEFYEVPLLSYENSSQLFCQKAFEDQIDSSDYEDLTKQILKYANGLPLAIKVLGSFLFGRSVSEWTSALARLRENPNKDIMDALKFSYYGLEEKEKEIFLDIACFFNWCEENIVKNILNCCGFHADIGLRVLIGKSLISISKESKVEMHGLLEKLGRKIVQENSTEEARKWSRLWLHKHCSDVISENMEKNVEAIVLKANAQDTQKLTAEALSNMIRLRLLKLEDVEVLGNLTDLSNQLRYVAWDGYPFMYLPSSFQPNQLVELILKYSKIEQLWNDKKINLPNLRTLDLSFSENLMTMSDFGVVPNLERLNLEGCIKLVEMNLSTGLPKKLVFLNLENCKSLKCIPNGISGLNSLEYLNLCSCSEAFNNSRDLEYPSLTSLDGLREVDISFCSLSHLPGDIGGLKRLERLNLGGNKFVTLPSFSLLSKLEYLNLEHCMMLTSFPELPSPAAINHDEYWRAGMYIFNCPNLVNRNRCSNVTFTWMMQFVLANQISSASFHRIDIVVPAGNEIPHWFDDQKIGRSISLNPISIILDNNVIGIVCCVVFSAASHDPTTATSGQTPVLQLTFHSDWKPIQFCTPVCTKLIMVESNHMWLTYFTRESFLKILKDIGNEAGSKCIRMEASIVEGEGLDVKSCGYRWVFNEDLQSGVQLFTLT